MLPGIVPVAADFSAPTLSYQALRTSTTNVGVGGLYTFTGTSIGTASADRLVICAVKTTNGATISAVTVGGVAATFVRDDYDVSIWYALVPTGTTATVSATVATATATNCSIGVYTLTGYQSAIPYADFNISDATSQTSLTDPQIQMQSGSVLVVMAARVGGGTVTFSTTGNSSIVEDFDIVLETNGGSACAHIIQDKYKSETVGITVSYTAAATYGKMVLAAWK